MITIFILFGLGSFVGALLIIFSILYRKRIKGSTLFSMCCLGTVLFVMCFIMMLCVGFFIR
jgi:hypothetical protein